MNSRVYGLLLVNWALPDTAFAIIALLASCFFLQSILSNNSSIISSSARNDLRFSGWRADWYSIKLCGPTTIVGNERVGTILSMAFLLSLWPVAVSSAICRRGPRGLFPFDAFRLLVNQVDVRHQPVFILGFYRPIRAEASRFLVVPVSWSFGCFLLLGRGRFPFFKTSKI